MHTSILTGQAAACPPTIKDFVEPFKHYPRVIRDAIMRALTHPSFSVLTKATRRVLVALLTRASKSDGMEPVMARVDRIAEEADVCEKTVQRALRQLRKFGWLEMSDGRSEWGVFTSRRYQFTRELCALVLLPIDGKRPKGTEMSDGLIEDLSFKKDQQEIFEEKQIELPEELQAIVEFGVKDTGVAKLRGMATDAGYRLEDIFACARKRLLELKASGGRVYRYLERMIGRDSDYAARATQITRITGALAAEGGNEAKYRNKRYTGMGAIVHIFDGAAEVQFNDGRFVTVPAAGMGEIYAAIASNKLQEVKKAAYS